MGIFLIVLSVIFIIGLLLLLTCFICFKLTFLADRKSFDPEGYNLPKGKIYEIHYDQMKKWIDFARSYSYEIYTIKSFDGLKLQAKYFECNPGGIVEILFHGYRGNSESDLAGGIQRCFSLKRNVLLVDQRASGFSEGKVITFGVNEHKDCLKWIDFVIEKFGPDVKIVISGVSMGAATVMMAAGRDLPSNVIHVLADCGYSSQKEIIKKVIRQMKLPDNLLYPFVKASAKIFGHFDLEEITPVEAMKKCKIPIIFFHGKTDAFVPWDMSKECFEALNAPKSFITMPDSGHGLCYIDDIEGYVKAVKDFSEENNLQLF